MYPISIPDVECRVPEKVRTVFGDHEVKFIISPANASDNWIYRIKVGNQYLVAFEKFETYAIGFQGSSGGWDLPYDCDVEEIYWMIKQDKKSNTPRLDVIQAIKVLKKILEARYG